MRNMQLRHSRTVFSSVKIFKKMSFRLLLMNFFRFRFCCPQHYFETITSLQSRVYISRVARTALDISPEKRAVFLGIHLAHFA